MSLSAELKRRLEGDDQPLSKRLRLAENVLSSPFFPTLDREETVIQWICSNLESSDKEKYGPPVILSLKACLRNTPNFKKFTTSAKSNLITTLSNLLRNTKPSFNDDCVKFAGENVDLIECCLILIENASLAPHFQQFIDIYFTFVRLILKNILQNLSGSNQIASSSKNTLKSFENDLHIYNVFSRRALNDLQNFAKSFSKKAMLVEAFIDTGILNVILEMSNDEKLTFKALSACQFILFPTASLNIFKSYMSTIVNGSSLEALIEEKGESLRPVVKVVDILLKYNHETDVDCLFLSNYIKLFIYSCASVDSLAFVFNVLLTQSLGIGQEYVKIQGNIAKVGIDNNMTRHVYLQNLKYLTEYNVNLNSKYPSISNEAGQSESTKGFLKYLQEVVMNILVDKSTSVTNSLLIINQAFKLDPAILENNINKILPSIMVEKKTGTHDFFFFHIYTLYRSVMHVTADIHIKLSRGMDFVLKILPELKIKLELLNRAQEKLILKQKKLLEKGEESAKLNDKIIFSEDIIFDEFCDIFGKLSSTLTSWQNIEMFMSLIKCFDEDAVSQLEIFPNSPSVMLLLEVLSSWLSSYMKHNRMADQNIPETVVKEFIDVFENFGSEHLSKFGAAVLVLPYNNRLLYSLLQLCHSYGQLKLILLRYQPYYETNMHLKDDNLKIDENVSNFSMLHSYLTSKQWKSIFKLVTKNTDEKCHSMMNCLILQKITTLEVFNVLPESVEIKENTRRHTFENLDGLWLSLMTTDYNTNILFSNLNASEIKMASSKIVSKILTDSNNGAADNEQPINILKMESIRNNQDLLSAILIECNRNLWLMYDNPQVLKKYKSIFEASDVENFDLKVFFNENIENINKYVNNLNDCHILKSSNHIEQVIKILDLLHEIPIQYLKENYQIATIFSIFLIKLATRKNENEEISIIFDDIESKCDRIIMRIFELSYKAPNLIQVFPPHFLFQIGKNNLFELTTYSGEKYNIAFKVLKFIFERTVTKENIKNLKCILKYLVDSCVSMETNESVTHITKLLHGHFQILSVLLIYLANMKKGNLSSEIKVPLLKYQTKVIETVRTIFNSVKWKSVYKKMTDASDNVNPSDDMKMDIDEMPSTSLENDITFTMNECKSGKLLKNNPTLAVLNLLESYSIIVNLESGSNKDDAVAQNSKSLIRGIEFFTCFSLAALSDHNICTQHAKGATSLISTALRNTIHKDEKGFHLKAWKATSDFLENDSRRSGSEWMEISNLNQENIKLIFELSEPKFINQVMTKQLLNFTTQLKPNLSSTQMTRKLWSCFLNTNFKDAVKNEARSNLVKQMCWHFFFWLRNNSSAAAQDPTDPQAVEADEGFVDGKSEKREAVALTSKNVEIAEIYFEVMTEFVSTKKMVLSHSIIDILLQMPVIVNFDVQTSQSYGNQESLKIFCTTFEKCTILINTILLHRSELLQDRWPCFMQVYRKLIKNLCVRSNLEKVTNKSEIDKLVVLATSIEKLTQTMVMKQRQDLARIASYLVTDIVGNFQKTPVCPAVKFHLQNCAYSLLQLLDTHAIGFIMRNMTDSNRIMFQRLYDNYNKYYKYTGKF